VTRMLEVPGVDEASWSGVFENMPFSEYHRRALGIASAGGLKLVRRSLAHYKAWATTPYSRRSRAFDFGSAYHAYVLTPETFATQYLVAPANMPRRPTEKQRKAIGKSFATLDAIAKWDAFDAEAASGNRLTLDARDYQKIQDMRAALDDEEMCGPLPGLILREGRREVTYRWIDPETGLPCRARFDYLHDGLGYGLDLKSCRDGSDEGFARAVTSLEYDISAAHYISGAHALERPLRSYIFLAQETEPPYVATPTILGDSFADAAFPDWRRAMNRLAGAVRSGRFPGYIRNRPDGFRVLEAPPYRFYREDTDE
jgi:hypothetical protein